MFCNAHVDEYVSRVCVNYTSVDISVHVFFGCACFWRGHLEASNFAFMFHMFAVHHIAIIGHRAPDVRKIKQTGSQFVPLDMQGNTADGIMKMAEEANRLPFLFLEEIMLPALRTEFSKRVLAQLAMLLATSLATPLTSVFVSFDHLHTRTHTHTHAPTHTHTHQTHTHTPQTHTHTYLIISISVYNTI